MNPLSKKQQSIRKVVNVLLFEYSPAKTVNVDFFLLYVYFVYVEREYICTTKRIHFPCYTLYLVYVVNVYMLSIGFLLPSMLHINHGVCYREVVLDNNQSYKRAKYILLLFEID